MRCAVACTKKSRPFFAATKNAAAVVGQATKSVVAALQTAQRAPRRSRCGAVRARRPRTKSLGHHDASSRAGEGAPARAQQASQGSSFLILIDLHLYYDYGVRRKLHGYDGSPNPNCQATTWPRRAPGGRPALSGGYRSGLILLMSCGGDASQQLLSIITTAGTIDTLRPLPLLHQRGESSCSRCQLETSDDHAAAAASPRRHPPQRAPTRSAATLLPLRQARD